MVKLTDEMKESLTGTKLVFLATSSKKSTPNVVPIGAFKLLDDETLLISDQFFNKTLQNMKENPEDCPVLVGRERRLPVQGIGNTSHRGCGLPAGCGVDERNQAKPHTKVRHHHENFRGLPG